MSSFGHLSQYSAYFLFLMFACQYRHLVSVRMSDMLHRLYSSAPVTTPLDSQFLSFSRSRSLLSLRKPPDVSSQARDLLQLFAKWQPKTALEKSLKMHCMLQGIPHGASDDQNISLLSFPSQMRGSNDRFGSKEETSDTGKPNPTRSLRDMLKLKSAL